MKEKWQKAILPVFAAVLFVMGCFSAPAEADFGQRLSYQGRLTDSNGVPLADGNYSMTFNIYTVETGGTAVWSETQGTVPVADGLFSAILGSGTSLSTVNFDSTEYWLEVQIGGTTYTPRQRITAAAMALNVPDSRITSAKVADNSLTAADLSVNVVSSMDGVTNDGGNIDLVAGTGISITPDDALDRITISTVASAIDHGGLTGLGDDDHTQYFNLSQNETVTGIPSFNGGTSGSSAPFLVDSNSLVSLLNADLLDGYNSGNASGNIPISNGTVNVNLNADLLDGYTTGNASGNIPLNNGTVNVNLNADLLDGYTTGNSNGNIPLNNGTVNTNLNADLLDGYTTGNASGNIPLSNGTVNTNLNADLLDGYDWTNVPNATDIWVNESGDTMTGSLKVNATPAISSDGDLYLDLDDNNDGTNYIYVRDGGNNTRLTIDESGNITMTGRLAQSATGFHSNTKDNLTTRTDSGFYQTNSATTANGWPETTSSWYHLLSNTHLNDANYYSMQFAANFFDSNALYYRSTNGSGTTGWNKVWHSGNDGSGSGLDADVLDGKHYSDATGDFVNVTGDTMTGGLTLNAGMTLTGGEIQDARTPAYFLRSTGSNANSWLFRESASAWGIYHYNTDDGSRCQNSILFTRADGNIGLDSGTCAQIPSGVETGIILDEEEGKIEAKILVDLDNTGYYDDPSSTSYLNNLLIGGSINDGDDAVVDIGENLKVAGKLDLTGIDGSIANDGSSGNIRLKPASSGGVTSIIFSSTVNWNSDYGYIAYYDDNNTYAYWGDSTENSALVIGVDNDGASSVSDIIALKSPAAVIVDAPELRVTGEFQGAKVCKAGAAMSTGGGTVYCSAGYCVMGFSPSVLRWRHAATWFESNTWYESEDSVQYQPSGTPYLMCCRCSW